MKKFFYFLIGIIIFFNSCSSPRYATTTVLARPNNYTYNTAPVGYDAFYNELSPYGRWIDYPGYGNVWSPNAEPDFRPYATDGHWVYSDYGWTWISDYNWGWAPFHYGRWFYEDGYGWLWLPGHEWAPAWVTWGQSGNYYGWAPMAPNVYNGNNWTPPQHYWNFVPAEHITKVNVNNYVVNNTTNTTVVNNITNHVTIINNTTNNITNITNNNITNNNETNNTTVYNRGPMVNDVERATNSKVQQVTINQSAKPGGSTLSGNQLTIYHPLVNENTNTGVKPVPSRVETYHPLNNQNAVQSDINAQKQVASPQTPLNRNNIKPSIQSTEKPVEQNIKQQIIVSPLKTPVNSKPLTSSAITPAVKQQIVQNAPQNNIVQHPKQIIIPPSNKNPTAKNSNSKQPKQKKKSNKNNVPNQQDNNVKP